MRTVSDQELIEYLHKSFERAKKKLGARGEKICAKELMNMLNVTNQASQLLIAIRHQKPIVRRNDVSIFVDIVQTLSHILDNINHEMHSIEIEMRGTRDYLTGEGKRLEHFQYMEQLHIEVTAMLRKLVEQRPEVRDMVAMSA